jgi:hypothetical protein
MKRPETIGRPHPHRATDNIGSGSRTCLQEFRFHALGPCQQFLASRRRDCAGGAPLKKLCVQIFLKLIEPARHCGMVEVQRLGRCEYLPGARNGQKDAEVVPVHRLTIIPAQRKRKS